MTRPVFRFAPSPNGRLHLGHAYSALLNADLAARAGGRFLVRIEDIDPVRSKPDFERAILDDLAWLGLSWARPVRRQSDHMAEYEAAARALAADGLLYPCVCVRGEIRRLVDSRPGWPRDPDGSPLYPGTCRGLSAPEIDARIAAGGRAALRLDTRRALDRLDARPTWTRIGSGGEGTLVEAHPERWGDPVLVRRDVPTSYHLSVVADDAVQGVTDVVRGQDLEPATDLHALLQRLLGLPSPRYRHHRLVVDRDGTKLSKRLGSRPLADLREAGTSPGEIRTALGLPDRSR